MREQEGERGRGGGREGGGREKEREEGREREGGMEGGREREREMRTQNKGQKNVVRNHSAIAGFEDGGKDATNQGKGKKWILP